MITKPLQAIVRVGSGLWLLSASLAVAQPTNGSVELLQERFTSGGGPLGSGTPIRLLSSVGQPAGGLASNEVVSVQAGTPSQLTFRWTPGSLTITVSGTVNEEAQVEVNGIPARLENGTFTASGIPLTEGPNTMTVTAVDRVGNATTERVTVYLDTQPPARPTASATPAITTATSDTLSGTKTAGTAISINGGIVVPFSDATSWTATVSLIEGDNVLVIAATDAAGNQSAPNSINIIVDNLPPVITVTSPSKTNVTPLLLRGTVDDSLDRVKVTGAVTTRSGRDFQAEVALSEGPNTITIIATSPNGYVSTKTWTVILGTIPTITAIQPADGSRLYVGSTATIQAEATDKENDPLECQILLNGQRYLDWVARAAHP